MAARLGPRSSSTTRLPSVKSRTAVQASGGARPGPALGGCNAAISRLNWPSLPNTPESRATRQGRPAAMSRASRAYSAESPERLPACDAARAPLRSTLTTSMLLSAISTSRNGKKRRSRFRKSHSRPGKQLPTPDSSRVETGLPATIFEIPPGGPTRRNAAMLRATSFTLWVLLMPTPPRRRPRRRSQAAHRSDRNRRAGRISASRE